MIRRVKRMALALALRTGLSEWVVRRLPRTSAPLPALLAALQDHLRAKGIPTKPLFQEPGWGGSRHLMGFQVGATGRLLFVAWSDSPETASRVAELLTTSKTASLPMVNGTLVACFNKNWPADDPLTRRVRGAFASFREAPAA